MEKNSIAEASVEEAINIRIEVTPGFLETIDRFVLSKGYGFENLGEFVRQAMRELLGQYVALYRTRGTSEKQG